jgi:hypothetical protein
MKEDAGIYYRPGFCRGVLYSLDYFTWGYKNEKSKIKQND